MNTREKGSKGETIAIDYLLEKGYRIITRNMQSKSGEIDCIAEDQDGTLVFIEVKTGYNDGAGHPFFWINRKKQKQIIRLAKKYLSERKLFNHPCRFDALAVIKGKVEHLENAFFE